MQDMRNFLPDVPRERVWLFNSGGSFSGNIKYLFIYINKYRPDIFACYITGDENNLEYIRSLGYRACLFKSTEGKALMALAGVYVNEDVKEHYPPELFHAKLLNLFHGVGLKAIERKWKRDYLGIKIAKKYIQYNEYISNNMCFLTTSPFMEKHFKEQLSLSDSQVIRSGYPRCVYQLNHERISTFDHDVIGITNISKDTQIALYAPTYREINPENFLYRAIQDIDKLISILKKNNILLIIKLHPKILNDFYFNEIRRVVKAQKNIVLWDNKYDIYEILDKIDIGIIDYSSIYYDLVAAGVKKFIRYIFDYDIEKQFLIYDYFKYTSGTICRSFDELLLAFEKPLKQDDVETINHIKETFWSYSNVNTCEQIIQQTLGFSPSVNSTLPILYSFDVFDTIIGRKVLEPRGIFYYVMERICQSSEAFPEVFKTEYVAIRMQAESNVREFVRKNIGDFEISFDAIFEHLNNIYHLSSQQLSLLKEWEIIAEFENVIPITDKINIVEQLVKDGEKVVLISDMYLPKNIICEMIYKVSPILAQVPLFLSSDCGVQKTTQKLYLEVYRSFEPYPFKEWHHYGDNKIADGDKAKKIGIIPHLHRNPSFNSYEQSFIHRCRDYNSYLFAGMLSRIRNQQNLTEKEYFAFAHAGCYFTPYIAWVIRDALARGFKTLYFISRDGYFLKKIADTYIKFYCLKIKTKYIYGSRRAWRVPSQINYIDDEFFSEFGNFVGVDNYEKLLCALHMPHHIFQKLFPELHFKGKETISSEQLTALRAYFKNSQKYLEYLLQKSAEEREVITKYIKQEIDFSESFAFVEFWGRGYTQTTLGKLLAAADQQDLRCHCYYYRSILPSQGINMRYNFSTNNTSLLFIEAIFANHPHSTVYGYKEKDKKIVPLMDKSKFDTELFYNMEIYLEKFILEFYSLPFTKNIEIMERMCSDISLYWYREHQDDPVLVKSLGHLLDSVEIYGTLREFAPVFSSTTLEMIRQGKSPNFFTRSLKMSLARSTPAIRTEYQAFLKNPQKSLVPSKQPLTREIRLRAKLEKNPQAFFADSHNYLIRLIGRTCFTSILRSSLGRGLVYVTKKFYHI